MRSSGILRAVIAMLAVLVFCGAAIAQEKRVALLIGNSAYEHAPRLQNPVNDARALGEALGRIGFETTVALDLDGVALNRALASFARETRDADIAVLFFAGHGLEIDGINYMLPVNAQISHADDVAYEALHLDKFLRAIGNSGTLKILLVDACRDNPFLQRIGDRTRSLGRGLTRVDPPGGVVVGYAAKGGTVALDGTGENSPYTAALLDHIEEPGLEINMLFRRISSQVFQDTLGRQEPVIYGALPSREVFLAGRSTITADFELASADGSVAGWEAFLARHRGAPESALLRAAQSLLAAARAAERRPAVETVTPERSESQPPELHASVPPGTGAVDIPVILSPREAEEALSLSQEDRRNTQQLLKTLGYEPGPLDGVFGRNTRVAIARFQLEHGLSDTSYLSDATVAALRDAVTAAPSSRDGRWRLTLNRRELENRANTGMVGVVGFVDFEIKGRNVEILDERNLSMSSNPSDYATVASLSRSGRLLMSMTINFVPHRSTSRRISVAADLPERVLVGQVFDLPTRGLSSSYVLEPKLRRISAGE